ncbi:MAG TPA: hypothetical protein VJ750_10080, partial [Rhizomicrobium sp.]|nr:hypothetical protein [Rhizomicrobium sp.]
GVGAVVGPRVGQFGFAGELITGAARGLAMAATRTLVNGSDFGDNIMASLPDMIGQTIGNMAVGAIQQSRMQELAGPTASNTNGDNGASNGTYSAVSPAEALAGLKAKFVNVPDIYAEAQKYNDRGLAYKIVDGQFYALYKGNVPLQIEDFPTGNFWTSAETALKNQMNDFANARAVPLDMGAVYQALWYDVNNHPKASDVVQKFFNSSVPIIPSNTGVDAFSPGVVRSLNGGDLSGRNPLNAVFWDSTAAIQTTVAVQKGGVLSYVGTGQYLSPALSLLHEIDHAVSYSISPFGNQNLHKTSAPGFNNLEEKRVISGVPVGTTFFDNSPAAIQETNKILSYSAGNGLENRLAVPLGEQIRTNHYGVFPPNSNVPKPGLTYIVVKNPTWHN